MQFSWFMTNHRLFSLPKGWWLLASFWLLQRQSLAAVMSSKEREAKVYRFTMEIINTRPMNCEGISLPWHLQNKRFPNTLRQSRYFLQLHQTINYPHPNEHDVAPHVKALWPEQSLWNGKFKHNHRRHHEPEAIPHSDKRACHEWSLLKPTTNFQ